ncbi:MAG TPA: diguanylate cyclase [Gammaproteobacteria bacterium]|nr:diguanylate cyclase [Gammaproteobacteria bacterium]
MNLRTRLLLRLLPVIFILGGTLYAYSKQVLKNDSYQIQEEHARQEMQGVRQTISYELDGLVGTTKEWAGRDAVGNFAREENSDFVDKNLTATSLNDINANLFLLLRPDGSVLHAAHYENRKLPGGLQTLAAERVQDLRQKPFVTQLLGELVHADASAAEYISARGLVNFNGHLMLIAAAPVLQASSASRGAAGLLVMGRYLEPTILYKISHISDLIVSLVPLPEGLQHGLDGTEKIVTVYPDSKTLTAYLRLDDIEGRPIGALRATTERWIVRGLRSKYYLLGSQLVAFLTLIGVVLWLLNHLMLQRLTLYDRIIDQIRKTDDMRNLRVPLHGRDELDRLGATVNEMLDTMANSRQRLYHDAYHDVLTGLPNRRLFIDRLNKIIQDSQHRLMRLGVVLLDLDGFKQINDTYGHDHGDELLRAVARRLEHCVRQTDTVARFGGDEFVVLLYNVDEDQAVEWITRKIVSALGQPYNIQDKSVTISASAGVALYPYNGGTAEKLLKTADVLMYHAKDAGKNTYTLADGIPHLATDDSNTPP